MLILHCKVEPLQSGLQRDQQNCVDYRGFPVLRVSVNRGSAVLSVVH